MIRSTALLVAIGIVLAAGTAWPQQLVIASPTEILRDPDRFDGHRVRVVGSVADLPRGSWTAALCTFNVTDGTTTISVLCDSPPSCPADCGVIVDGVFHRELIVHGRRFLNHLEPITVTCEGPRRFFAGRSPAP